jgi:hypothetical protein
VSSELKTELVTYYAQPDAPYSTKKNPKEWAKVKQELAQLKNTRTEPNIVNTAEASKGD